MAILLIGSPVAASDGDVPVDAGIQAFVDVCVATAPDFAKAAEEAAKLGVVMADSGGAQTGASGDNAFSIQVKAGHDCSVRTETRPGEDMATQFLAIAGLAAGTLNLPTSLPFTATYSGKTFTFSHNRNGGENYIMTTE